MSPHTHFGPEDLRSKLASNSAPATEWRSHRSQIRPRQQPQPNPTAPAAPAQSDHAHRPSQIRPCRFPTDRRSWRPWSLRRHFQRCAPHSIRATAGRTTRPSLSASACHHQCPCPCRRVCYLAPRVCYLAPPGVGGRGRHRQHHVKMMQARQPSRLGPRFSNWASLSLSACHQCQRVGY